MSPPNIDSTIVDPPPDARQQMMRFARREAAGRTKQAVVPHLSTANLLLASTSPLDTSGQDD
jgi:hypothetical protein